jgi:tRNA pseudouridine32 synthase/23S rRNA pseudouridine746 synthase
MTLEVIYKDSLMLAINKPAGLPVHKGAGRKMKTLEDYLDELRFGLPKRPELAHRLDKDTTGCLILGRNKVALKRLSELFLHHKIQKTYLALVHGDVISKTGEINYPIAKKSKDKRSWWGKVDEQGQPALTQYEVLYSSQAGSLVKLIPITGRTHQLRIHMQAIGHPIVGDSIYGTKHDKNSLCLHCAEMEVPLYAKRESIVLKAPLPDLFNKTMASMGIELN